MDFENVEALNAELLRRVAENKDESEGADAENLAFTRSVIDWMTAEGGWNDGNAFEFSARGMHASGYAWDGADPGVLDVYVSVFNPAMTSQTMSVSEIDRHLDRGTAFVREVLEGRRGVARFENGPAADLSTLIDSGRGVWETIRIVLIANARILSNARAGGFSREDAHIGGVRLEFQVWDLDRMFRLFTGGKGHEPVTVDFEKDFGAAIPCLDIPRETDEYSACLAVFPGDVLADVYERYGTQLLEKNVRVFLQERGKVNKGILETIEKRPQMFLAFNNGISITARGIEFGTGANGQKTLRRLEDFQIVNGGQTTASLHNARKKHKLPLGQTFVQAKISVVGNGADEDSLVRDISLYANSQNKVKKSDLGADGAFHRALEMLSRETWTPNGRSKWFYERAEGQYGVAQQLAGNVYGGRQSFEREYPKSQRIKKTDVAKAVLAWQGAPEIASLGGEKCFQKFAGGIPEGFVPDEMYFKTLVAKLILFREIDAIVKEQGDTGYKANVIAYTLALMNAKTDNRMNLLSIWACQGVPERFRDLIDRLVRRVRKTICDTAAAGGITNVTEWGKKSACWEEVQKLDVDADAFLHAVGDPLAFPGGRGAGAIDVGEGETGEQREARERVEKLKAANWYGIAQWGHDTRNLNDWQVKFTASIAGAVSSGKRLSTKQVAKCREALDAVESCGVDPSSL